MVPIAAEMLSKDLENQQNPPRKSDHMACGVHKNPQTTNSSAISKRQTVVLKNTVSR
jgi:hypothetical protein